METGTYNPGGETVVLIFCPFHRCGAEDGIYGYEDTKKRPNRLALSSQ
jgi:hypothetical protein